MSPLQLIVRFVTVIILFYIDLDVNRVSRHIPIYRKWQKTACKRAAKCRIDEMTKAKKKAVGPQVLTANRLVDGDVVYWVDETSWVESLSSAKVFADPTELETAEAIALAQVAEQKVLDPYPFPIEMSEAGELSPTQMREIIRAKGPTVRLDLGKQARGVST